VRALSLPEWGATPIRADVPTPVAAPGMELVRVRAAALNPLDLAVASGRFYMPLPEPPFVPGAEVVGELVADGTHPAGTRVWCLVLTGGLCEVLAVPSERLVPVPDGISDELAVALGVAGLAGWMPVHERGSLAPGETVVVLGASGVVGQVAVCAARAGGAGRVVAVARRAEGRERALALGADVTLPTGDGLAEALREACPDGADLVIDALWGDSAAAAIGAAGRGARLVQVGNAESPVMPMVAGPLRGRRLDLLGFSVLVEEPAAVARAYGDLTAAVLAGDLDVELDIDVIPLEAAVAAWERQAAGTRGHKLVVRV
jgi:NADPH:quinone reductase-like Zn-dependent oxidoreductase